MQGLFSLKSTLMKLWGNYTIWVGNYTILTQLGAVFGSNIMDAANKALVKRVVDSIPFVA